MFIIFILLFFFPSPCNSISSSMQNNFTLYGDANFIKEDAITLTQEQQHNGYRRALYKCPIRFLDPLTNTSMSFSCQFSFTITTSPFLPCGDGLAFFITSNATSISHVNGHFGLPESKQSFFAVEFDTSFDPDLGDINDDHVGVDIDSVVSFASVGVDYMGINLKIGREITAWIQYEEKTKMLNVWLSNLNFKPREPVISTNIDLGKKVFKEFMHIGYTASNRREGSSRHVIESWQFKTFGFVVERSIDAEVIDVDNSSCLMCLPENGDFAIQDRFLHSQQSGGMKMLEEAVVGLGGGETIGTEEGLLDRRPFNEPGTINKALGGAGLLMFTVVMVALFLKWADLFQTTEPPKFSFKQVEKASKSFTRKIGGGNAADVFLGSLALGNKVAVKRYRQEYIGLKAFKLEQQALRYRLRHPNIIRCLGWCEEGDLKVMVFEFMSKGSMRDFFPLKSAIAPACLSWPRRQSMILDVAAALKYLHNKNVIHGDVSASHIMLDNKLNAKLGNFGSAEFEVEGASLVHGTSKDIYKFGVLALETSTGMMFLGNKYRASKYTVWEPIMVEAYERDLIDEVWKLKMNAADKRLKGNFEEEQMHRMITVGLLYTLLDPAVRLSIDYAESILKISESCPALP